MTEQKNIAWRKLNRDDDSFFSQLDTLLNWDDEANATVQATVADILQQVKTIGDAAVIQLTNKLDKRQITAMAEVEISKQQQQEALQRLTIDDQEALKTASARIRSYHENQKQESWSYQEADGTRLGQIIRPMDRVGIYVPGGKASYPSSVLMNAIPAKVAGVTEVIMVVPAPEGELDPRVLAAAALADVDRLFTVGGAQAIAALAFGTQTIPRVDKIVGPGNIYVATAKQMVFGQVGLDMIAGPSEILVVCDGKTNPDWIAMDLFSQAEHDENAQSILLTTDTGFAEQVQRSMEKLLPSMDRQDIIQRSLQTRGAVIIARNYQQMIEVINRIAPEHLELSVEDPESWLKDIRHAGAIFMGRYTAEALGDYCAGPNHVLPTSGTARFSSPLGVYDFVKRSSLIWCSSDGAHTLGKVAVTLAEGESLPAHAASARYRIQGG